VKHALIETKNGRVAQVVDFAEQKFAVHPDLEWREVTDDITQDDKLEINGSFTIKGAAERAVVKTTKVPVSE